jgi:RimJ/RimL family protein N-acetyltransferase
MTAAIDPSGEESRVTARLILRPWGPNDIDPFSELCSEPEAMRFINEGQPLKPDEISGISERSLRMWREKGFGPWSAREKASGSWVGRIGLNELPDWPGEHKIEVGFELRQEFWGKGLATEAARAALAFGFQDHGLERIISVTRIDHTASRRVMEKIGLVYQGTLRFRTAHVAWYALKREAWFDGEIRPTSS